MANAIFVGIATTEPRGGGVMVHHSTKLCWYYQLKKKLSTAMINMKSPARAIRPGDCLFWGITHPP